MAALVWTQADVDQLKAAVVGGVLTVSFSGPPARTVTYQSLASLREALAAAAAAVDAAAGTRPSYKLIGTRKGL